jgi:hypothetical protein
MDILRTSADVRFTPQTEMVQHGRDFRTELPAPGIPPLRHDRR